MDINGGADMNSVSLNDRVEELLDRTQITDPSSDSVPILEWPPIAASAITRSDAHETAPAAHYPAIAAKVEQR
jgi:hypothetical protein